VQCRWLTVSVKWAAKLLSPGLRAYAQYYLIGEHASGLTLPLLSDIALL
jgi:hypothetical protein